MAYGTNIENFIKELNIKNEDKPKLSFITQNLNFEELPKIYQSADIFVCSIISRRIWIRKSSGNGNGHSLYIK